MQAARHEYEVNEQDGLAVQRSRNPLGTGDSNGDIFAVALRSAGGGYSSLLGVTVKGEVIRADGQTVYLTGSVSSYYATVTLSPACYAVPGDLELTIKLSAGSMTRSVLRVKLDVIACTTEILATYSEGGGSIADLTGAVRYDAAQNLSDAQKAQARANIGITSTGADISGLIDDNTTAPDKVWSSENTAGWIADMASGLALQIGTLGDLETSNKSSIVAAINEVNAKAGSGTGGSSGAAINDTTTSTSTTWSSSKITQAINDAAAGEMLPTDPLRVECWGDSLTFGAGAAGDDWSYSGAYPAVLAGLLHMEYPEEVHNYGVGEENSETILARMGTTPMYVVNQTNIGADAGSVSTVKLASATGAEVKPLRQIPKEENISGKDKGVNTVTIAGIEGTLSYDSTLGYIFTRKYGGSSTPILHPTEVVTAYKRMEHDNRVRVIWMGQNDILDTELEDIPMLTQYLIEACRSAIRGVDKYIILTSPVGNGSTAEPYKPLHRAMVHAFGDHCINIVDYLIQHGLTDAGATATQTDSENIAAYKIPRSLRATNSNGTEDHIHLNAAGYAVVANQVYKRGQLLGYWT